MSLPVSLPDVLDANARTMASRIHTCLPGKVVSYNPTTNTADVQICVKAMYFDLDGGREYDEMPTLPGVPIIWPRGGGFVMTLPIGPGDFVWLMFSELSLAEWRATGQLSEPTDARRHSIGYPYAIPGAFPDVSPMSPSPLDLAARVAGAVIGQDSGPGRIEITASGIKLGSAAAIPIALGPPVVAFMAAVAAWIAAVSPKILTIPAPLTGGEQTAVTTAAGVVATAASAAATATNATLTKAI